MAAPTLSEIFSRVGATLVDTDHTRWTTAFITDAVNEATRVIVELRPAANMVHIAFPLQAGPRQTLLSGNSDVTVLHDIVSNWDVANSKHGKAVRYVDREVMNLVDPTWPTHNQSKEVKTWSHDQADPLTFWVYPPNSGTGAVYCLVSKVPASLPNDGNQQIAIHERYQDAIVEFVLYLAYAREANYGNQEKAQMHLATFSQMMGAKPTIDLKYTAKAHSKGAQQDATDTMGGA